MQMSQRRVARMRISLRLAKPRSLHPRLIIRAEAGELTVRRDGRQRRRAQDAAQAEISAERIFALDGSLLVCQRFPSRLLGEELRPSFCRAGRGFDIQRAGQDLDGEYAQRRGGRKSQQREQFFNVRFGKNDPGARVTIEGVLRVESDAVTLRRRIGQRYREAMVE